MPPEGFEPAIAAGERPQTYDITRPVGSATNAQKATKNHTV